MTHPNKTDVVRELVRQAASVPRLKADRSNAKECWDACLADAQATGTGRVIDEDGSVRATMSLPKHDLVCDDERCAAVRAERDEARAEVARLEAHNQKLWQDRYDALNVKSRDGLLSSEWVARTGKAERERDEARAELEAVRGDRDGLLVGMKHCHEDVAAADKRIATAEAERDAYRAMLADVLDASLPIVGRDSVVWARARELLKHGTAGGADE